MAKRVFRLEIECENAAFDEAPGYEIARILRNAGSQMEQGFIDGTLRDANGNKVGRFELADEQEAEAEIDRILARLDREIPEQEARVQRLMERYGLVKKEKP